jgi:hypothetical protein
VRVSVDPENPVVKLCAAGMQAEALGKPEAARELYLAAWNARTGAYDGCLAAHYVARHQSRPEDGLHWNQISLDLARETDDDLVRGFFSSLYLNLGRSHETLGNRELARQSYDLAEAHLADVPEGAYGDVVRGGLTAARARMA